jgi:magnesium chelatase family protein
MASVVNCFALSGVDGYVVKIETDTIYGQPSVSIVGLGDASVKEAKERLEASIIHIKYEFPKMKIVINLSPGDIKKSGSHFDLAMAIGLLIQSKQISTADMQSFGFIGELSLNGDIRACSGILPMAIEARQRGIIKLIVPKENISEASLVKGISIFGFDKLTDVISFLEGVTPYSLIEESQCKDPIQTPYLFDFKEVQGQDAIIEFIMVAAAGGHNLLMSGAPGCGKSMIAKRIPSILPSMSEKEALEVTKIYSVAGVLKNKGALITERPFRAPHHNASMNSLVGGGNNATPGEISLSHNGVLFLDEIAEFNKKTLDALRQPMEDNEVTISRVKYTNVYPASFMLIAAMNPCPCGYYGQQRCHCTDYEVLKYRQKISGPMLDRIDIQKYVMPVDFIKLSDESQGISSAQIRAKVEFARSIQRERYKDYEKVNSNAEMTPDLIKRFCVLDDESKKILRMAFERFNYSARTYHKFLKVARTFADIDGARNISKSHMAKALLCRDLDKEQAHMVVI